MEIMCGGDLKQSAKFAALRNIAAYTLAFNSGYGLWRLEVLGFKARFYRTRCGAERLIERYRRAIVDQIETASYHADEDIDMTSRVG